MAKTSFNMMLSEYNANLQNIEGLKKELQMAAMHGDYQRVEKLKDIIINYEKEVRAFEYQTVEYKHVGEK